MMTQCCMFQELSHFVPVVLMKPQALFLKIPQMHRVTLSLQDVILARLDQEGLMVVI